MNEFTANLNGKVFHTLKEYRQEIFSILRDEESTLAWDWAWDYCQENDIGNGFTWAQELLGYDEIGVTCEKDVERLRNRLNKILAAEGLAA